MKQDFRACKLAYYLKTESFTLNWMDNGSPQWEQSFL